MLYGLVCCIGLEENKLRKVAKEREVRMKTYDADTGLFKDDKEQAR